MRSDSDSWLATSAALLPPPSTLLRTIRKTWCRDHAEDIGRVQASQFLQRRVADHLLHRHRVGMIRDSPDRDPSVAELYEEQHIIRYQAPPREHFHSKEVRACQHIHV